MFCVSNYGNSFISPIHFEELFPKSSLWFNAHSGLVINTIELLINRNVFVFIFFFFFVVGYILSVLTDRETMPTHMRTGTVPLGSSDSVEMSLLQSLRFTQWSSWSFWWQSGEPGQGRIHIYSSSSTLSLSNIKKKYSYWLFVPRRYTKNGPCLLRCTWNCLDYCYLWNWSCEAI